MTGKLGPLEIERLVVPHLGAARAEVLHGPGPGGDAAIVRAGAGRVLAITSDPLSLVPALGPETSARLACHLVASDLWCSGIPPGYATVTLNLPPDFETAMLERYLASLHATWSELGVAVVAGHTGRYQGIDLSIVGAATLIGIGDEGRWIGTPFVRPGDRVLMTGHAAFETTAIAARLFPHRLAESLRGAGLDPEVELERVRGMIDQVSVVEPCRAALRAGVRDQGVSALHDLTEGGVLGGLIELARGAHCDVRVERSKIPLPPVAKAACEAFGVDPYWALSEGALLVCARPGPHERVLAALAEAEIAAVEIGEVLRGDGVLWLTDAERHVLKLTEAEPDPYWPAYARAVREGWN